MRRDLTMQLKTFEKTRSDYVTELHTRPRTSANEYQHSYEPSQKRSKFDSSEFIKELETYEKSRNTMQDYFVAESQQLLSSRLEIDH
jgi:hypothetical protein